MAKWYHIILLTPEGPETPRIPLPVFSWHYLTLIQACIGNYVHFEVMDEIILNFDPKLRLGMDEWFHSIFLWAYYYVSML